MLPVQLVYNYYAASTKDISGPGTQSCLSCLGLAVAHLRTDFLWACFGLVEPRSHTCPLAVGEVREETFPTSTMRWRTHEEEYSKEVGEPQIRQIPTEDGRYQHSAWNPADAQWKFLFSFSFTDFHPSDLKLWGGINNAVWIDEKATRYYLRLPERNRKFSPCCRHLPERQAAEWDLAQSRNNVLGICLNTA